VSLRQGSILSEGLSQKILNRQLSSDEILVLISHDCDLSNDKDLEPEYILGKLSESEDGNLSHGKNPRKLCLAHPTDPTKFIELEQHKKAKFSQNLLRNNTAPTPVFSENSLKILRYWLASRYSRSAFPDTFENRMRLNKKRDNLQNTLKKFGKDILVIYVDLYGDTATEKAEEDPYLLKIYLVYDTTAAPESRKQCEKAADIIRGIFKDFNPDSKDQICLEACEVVADSNFSLASIRKLHRWMADFFSFTPKINRPEDVV